MPTYYIHKQTKSREIPYSFQCEGCMKDSGPLTAILSGTQVEQKSLSKTMKEKEQKRLEESAYQTLKRDVNTAYTDATQKQRFDTAFRDICPHCGQPQSWSVSGMKNNAASNMLVALIVGAVVATGVYVTQGRNLLLSLGFMGAAVLVAAGIFAYQSVKIGAKKKKMDGALQQNLPVIDWSVVQDLLK